MKAKKFFSVVNGKKREDGYGSLFALMVTGMLLLGLLFYSVSTHAQITLTYNQSFTSGVVATTQCTAWNAYRATLLAGYTYSGFNISGSMNPVGITCTDPVIAKRIADTLRVNGQVFGLASDGHIWFVQGNCGAPGATELGGDVPGGGCSCSPTGYSVRPCFPTPNWGGINGPSCGPASQTLIVKFFVVPVSFNNGPTQTISLCENASTSISSLLTITDGEGDTETWTVSAAPVHGTIGGLPVSAPSDTNVTPAGVTYTPTPGFTGTDVFSIQVNNGFQTAVTTISVTISPAPNPIGGSHTVCTANTTTLTETTGSGAWASSNPAFATISPTGTVSGIAVGTLTISYTAAGCSTTFPMTVNQTPAPITGPSAVCSGSTLTLGDTSPGGTWTSSSTPTATVGSSSGVVTGGGTPGADTIIYTLPGGCNVTLPITVNTTPAAITGSPTVCTGNSVTLTETTGGGTWSSSSAHATVGSTGTVTGVTAGTAIISYTTAFGCYATFPMTVNQTPGAITGSSAVCSGQTITLGDPNPGGVWTSSATLTASVGSSSGVVTGAASGTATITYTLAGGCNTTTSITVNPTPVAITGASSVCAGSSVTLSDATAGGTWSSSNPALATVGSTGVVSGTTAGPLSIIYTLPAGCSANYPFTVNPVPTPISGITMVCISYTSTLTDGVAGGTWTSSTPAVASVGSTTGVVTGNSPGTATITYTLPAGCSVSVPVTVSSALPPIAGPSIVCIGNTATLTDPTPGGTWSSSIPGNVSIDPATGLMSGVSPGTVTITYTLGACVATKPVTADPAPAPITGGPNVCLLTSTTLSDATPLGTWSSSNPAIATVGSATGVVTGGIAGSVTITYSLGAGCSVSALINVQPLPAAIAGPAHICLGATATFTDATPGGTWSSSNPVIAPISVGGIATGMGGGMDTLFYTLSSGCSASRALPIISVPAFTGLDTICAWGDTVTVNDSNTTGLYTSSLVTVVNLGGGAAVVYGHAAGIATVTYTVPAGCYVMESFPVHPLPAVILGSYNVCTGLTSALSDASPGGLWSSSNPAVATIDPFSGLLTGISGGSVLVTYTLITTGCKVDTMVTVTPPPSLIAGPGSVCLGASVALSDSVGGGSWTSSAPAIASVTGSGVVNGNAAGTATISYSVGPSCMTTKTITVNPLPTVFVTVGGGGYCAGGTGAHVWLNGSQAGVNYQLYNGPTAVGAPVAGTGLIIDFGPQPGAGTYTVTATFAATSCSMAMAGSAVINVLPVPVAYSLTGGGPYCAGGPGPHIGLGGSQVGINYQLFYGALPLGSPAPGTGGPIDFGIHSAVGTYLIIGTNPTTTCSNSMADTVTVSIASTVVPSVSVAVLPGDTVCPGTAVSLTGTPVNGGAAPTYQWSVNGVNTGTGNVYAYTPANGDHVRVLLTSSAPCAVPDTAATSVTLTVETGLAPVVTITAVPGTTVLIGVPVTFTASVTGGGTSLTYQWEVNGSPVPGATLATFTRTPANGDVVTCVVNGTGGPCGPQTGNAHVTMIVNDPSLGVYPVSGISGFMVIPNPNKGDFTVTGTLSSGADEEVALTMTDMLGREVYKNNVQAKNGKLEAGISLGSNVAGGTYILSIRTGAGNQVFHIVIDK